MFYQKESLDGSEDTIAMASVPDVRFKVDSIPSVVFRCKICGQGITNHSKGCSSRYLPESGNEKRDKEFLWLLSYFHKYGDNSIWGEWIQDSLDMRVTFSNTKQSEKSF